MNELIQRVIDLANGEVGYLEKASNANLDDKTANAGKANYTKYARDMDKVTGYFNGRKQAVAWCAVFVNWLFYQLFGMAAKKMLFQPDSGNCAAGCGSARSYFNKNGHLFNTPEPGDQIFFWSSDKSSVSHTGLVVGVDSERVYTIEGNTSDGTSVIANGGAVCAKSYPLGYQRIAGYGRPDWSKAEGQPIESAPAEPATEPATGTAVDYAAEAYAESGKTVNLRASMSTNSRVVSTVPIGMYVQVMEEIGEWARCRYDAQDGQTYTGYMMRKYLRKPDQETKTVTISREHLVAIKALLVPFIQDGEALLAQIDEALTKGG